MGFFSNLFKKKNIKSSNFVSDTPIDNPECRALGDLKKYMLSLLSANQYIPKSEYRSRLHDEEKVVEYFTVLDSSGMLKTFCNNNHISVADVDETLACYINFESLIDSHNDDCKITINFVERQVTCTYLSTNDVALRANGELHFYTMSAIKRPFRRSFLSNP